MSEPEYPIQEAIWADFRDIGRNLDGLRALAYEHGLPRLPRDAQHPPQSRPWDTREDLICRIAEAYQRLDVLRHPDAARHVGEEICTHAARLWMDMRMQCNDLCASDFLRRDETPEVASHHYPKPSGPALLACYATLIPAPQPANGLHDAATEAHRSNTRDLQPVFPPVDRDPSFSFDQAIAQDSTRIHHWLKMLMGHAHASGIALGKFGHPPFPPPWQNVATLQQELRAAQARFTAIEKAGPRSGLDTNTLELVFTTLRDVESHRSFFTGRGLFNPRTWPASSSLRGAIAYYQKHEMGVVEPPAPSQPAATITTMGLQRNAITVPCTKTPQR